MLNTIQRVHSYIKFCTRVTILTSHLNACLSESYIDLVSVVQEVGGLRGVSRIFFIRGRIVPEHNISNFTKGIYVKGEYAPLI